MATKEAIGVPGRTATIYAADLSLQASVVALIPTILCGGHRVDILVNCAGIQRRHQSHRFPDSDWNEVLQVNLTSVFTLCRATGAYMLSQPRRATDRRGAIINFASLLSFQGGITVPAYCRLEGHRRAAHQGAGERVGG